MSRLTRSRKFNTVDRVVRQLQDAHLIFNRADTGNGSETNVDGHVLTNLGSCSYMGLETHPLLVEGARSALDQYGTQFSFSRAYLEMHLYRELEAKLDEITGRHVLVTPSTTLGHLAALPLIVGDADLVVVDQFAHASLHMAIELLKGNVVERLRHNRMDILEQKLEGAAQRGQNVWYIFDGVYSMLGDYADWDALEGLLERYPRLHLYVDDAHAVSWTGKFGRGAALQRFSDNERVVVALSLNKAFSAAGGALTFTSAALRDKVRRCGGPMLFSGPLQPPMLGAAVASANLHLDAAFPQMQAELDLRIRAAQSAIDEFGLQVVNRAHTPIFMVQFDSTAQAFGAVTGVREAGFYCCPSTFPAVPIDKPSLRFTVSRHNSLEQIESFVETLAQIVQRVVGPKSESAPTSASA